MVVVSGGFSTISLSFDGNVSASTTSNNVIVVPISITENTVLTTPNTNNIDVFLCKANVANKEVILPTNITLPNYIINIINTSDTYPLRVRSIKEGDRNYKAKLVSNIYSWSYPSYSIDESGNIILDENDYTERQYNFILPPKRSVRFRYILDEDDNLIYFYEV